MSITNAAAVDANGVPPGRKKEILPAMWFRILRVLAVGLAHDHDVFVLGAWGCGAFGNDSDEIASLFHGALTENFSVAYGDVVFAIVDWSLERRFIGPFEIAFSGTI